MKEPSVMERSSTLLYFIALGLLLLVLIPGFGKTVNGDPFYAEAEERLRASE